MNQMAHSNGSVNEAASTNPHTTQLARPAPVSKRSRPKIDDHLEAVLEEGISIVRFERACDALRDHNLEYAHRAVLAELLEGLSRKHGTTWPLKETLAKRLGLSVRTVENTLYDLRALGYIAWERRPVPEGPAKGARATQYVALTRTAGELMQEEIAKAVLALRSARRRPSKIPPPAGENEIPPPAGEKIPPPAGEKAHATLYCRSEPIEEPEEEDVIDADFGEAVVAAENGVPKVLPCAVEAEPRQAFALYAATAARCGLAVPRKPEPYLVAIGARLRDSGGIDGWKEMLRQVEQSPFLRGENGTGFRAWLTWLTKRENYTRVIDGEYAPWARSAGSTSTSIDPVQREADLAALAALKDREQQRLQVLIQGRTAEGLIARAGAPPRWIEAPRWRRQ
jgi:hypothetical protein